MLKIFSWVVITPMIVVVTVFSVVNRHPVTVDFWPLDVTAELRMFVVVLGAVVIVVLWGGLGAWIAGANGRRRARDAARRTEAAETQARQAKARIAELEEAGRTARRGEAGPVLSALPAPADAA